MPFAVGALGVFVVEIVTFLVTCWQPGVLSLTVTVYVPALFTTIEEVVSPVFHTYVKGALPPEVEAVSVTLYPEQMLGADWFIVTFKVQGCAYPFITGNRKRSNNIYNNRCFLINHNRFFTCFSIFYLLDKGVAVFFTPQL
jgi:hypothetical protein